METKINGSSEPYPANHKIVNQIYLHSIMRMVPRIGFIAWVYCMETMNQMWHYESFELSDISVRMKELI